MERPTTVTSLKSEGRRVEDWISTLAMGGGAKKRDQYCVNPINSCTFEQFKDIQETMLLILHCKTTYCFRKDSPNASATSKTRINGMRNKPQERKTSSLLHQSEPDGRRTGHRRNTVRSYDTKIRAIQEYLETPYKYSILVQFEARSRERLAILPNTLTCSRSLQHTATCIEKAGCIQTKGEPYQKCRLTGRKPRVVLKSNSVHKIHRRQETTSYCAIV